MAEFAGDRTFTLPVEVVAARLSDAGFLVGCLDKVDQVLEAAPDRAVLKLRTGFSFLSTTLEVTLNVVERSPTKTTFEALSRGVGASSRVSATLNFEADSDGTKVHYEAAIVERTGFLKIVSTGLIQAAAKTVIEDTWKSIEAKLKLA
ncbi:MAG TPA: SRPBCC domain-containing protein [Gemmataceae bacterium]|jgi:carbon monoxide dehydrogenase subunit G|nr:SRPBCC domain-containing protein [Gemmataceae bacterium]